MQIATENNVTSVASESGIFYVDCSGALHLVFPSEVLLRHLVDPIIVYYNLLKSYDQGAAFEFLVCAQLQLQGNVLLCKGDSSSTVGQKLSSKRFKH